MAADDRDETVEGGARSSWTTYVVVMRSTAGFYFGRDDALTPMRFPTEIGPMELTFGTSRTHLPGFGNPVRLGLWADARGQAPSLGSAIDTYANFARGVAAVLSVAANAPVGDLTADLAFDATPGRREREYWRRYLPDDPLIPRRGRRLSSGLALALITAWMRHTHGGASEVERWHRAFNQYHHALQSWEPGLEITALGHLWVGMEALTPIALDAHLEQEALTRDQLAKRWKVELSRLDAEARKRLLFREDDECYQQARKARNGLQHGFEALGDVRTRAMAARDRTATYLRNSLINLVGLEPEVRAALVCPPFDRPFYWSFVAELHGRLVADSDEVANPADVYPRVDWDLVPTELPPDADGDAGVEFAFWVNPQLADGVEFEVDGVSFLAPEDDGTESTSVLGPGVVAVRAVAATKGGTRARLLMNGNTHSWPWLTALGAVLGGLLSAAAWSFARRRSSTFRRAAAELKSESKRLRLPRW